MQKGFSRNKFVSNDFKNVIFAEKIIKINSAAHHKSNDYAKSQYLNPFIGQVPALVKKKYHVGHPPLNL